MKKTLILFVGLLMPLAQIAKAETQSQDPFENCSAVFDLLQKSVLDEDAKVTLGRDYVIVGRYSGISILSYIAQEGRVLGCDSGANREAVEMAAIAKIRETVDKFPTNNANTEFVAGLAAEQLYHVALSQDEHTIEKLNSVALEAIKQMTEIAERFIDKDTRSVFLGKIMPPENLRGYIDFGGLLPPPPIANAISHPLVNALESSMSSLQRHWQYKDFGTALKQRDFSGMLGSIVPVTPAPPSN